MHDASKNRLATTSIKELIKRDKSNGSSAIRLDTKGNVKDARTELNVSWASPFNMFRFQPLNRIRDYFGEHFALYFAWSGQLIASLVLPTVIGIIFFSVSLSNRLEYDFCFILIIL